jgi:Family of unknown function (DUF5691)
MWRRCCAPIHPWAAGMGREHMSGDPFLPEIQARIRQAFLLGLARAPLTTPPALAPLMPAGKDPALALLALAGQRQRFAPPPALALEDVPHAAKLLHEDPRPVMPVEARRAFSRLTGSVEKVFATTVLGLAVERITAAGYRLHPFDLPEAARHIRPIADRLGPAEQVYLAMTAPDGDEDAKAGLFFDRITADTWTTFPKSRRRAFLVEQRRADAAAGRALLEGVWKAEPAPVRLVLLEALATNLGADDAPFLEKLATDRAETVKRAAALLLARMPTTEAYETRLAAAAACFAAPAKTGVSGFIKSLAFGSADAVVFTVPPPKSGTTTNWAEMQAMREQMFAGVPLRALATVAGLTPEQIVQAFPGDEHVVLMQLIETARADDDTDMLARIVGTRLLTSSGLHGSILGQFANAARVVIAPAVAEQLLSGSKWAAAVAEYLLSTQAPTQTKDDGRLVFTACLLPREAMPAFLKTLEPLAPNAVRGARDFADMILALPAAGAAA